jgi:hypothetical protein
MGLKGSFEVLLDRVQALGVFRRNKKPLRVKVLSTLFYYAGLSYRVTAGFMGFEAEFNYEAVRQWRNRLEEALMPSKGRLIREIGRCLPQQTRCIVLLVA